MTDDAIVDIRFCEDAEAEVGALRKDASGIWALKEIVLARGWRDALAAGDIKPFTAKGFVGEVFYLKVQRRPGFRLYFFCEHGDSGRVLHVTHVHRTAWMKKKSRYRSAADACEKVRQQWLRTGDC